VLRSIDESLERLGLSYIDCMQVHDPEYAPSIDIVLDQVLPALHSARASGKIRYGGERSEMGGLFCGYLSL
jgi:aryl-alcohol dehydrogenase-like predicted oxidoreductase